jgi:hypothetical protein
MEPTSFSSTSQVGSDNCTRILFYIEKLSNVEL